jgi:hypothetical protein
VKETIKGLAPVSTPLFSLTLAVSLSLTPSIHCPALCEEFLKSCDRLVIFILNSLLSSPVCPIELTIIKRNFMLILLLFGKKKKKKKERKAPPLERERADNKRCAIS